MKKPKYETCDLMHGQICVSTPCICKGMHMAELRNKKRKSTKKLISRLRTKLVKPMKHKIICYCGSLRVALDAFKKAEYQSVLNGHIALLPSCMFVDIQREYGAESDYKLKADELHKRKIDICDEVHVLNVGGYIGESTRNEIKYAYSIGKPVVYIENEMF